MKNWSLLVITAALFVNAGVCHSSQTLVPKDEQISDFEAKLNLARILSHNTETQKEALRYYETLLKEKPTPLRLTLHQESSEVSKTIVPKNNWISHFDTAWALAKIYSHKKDSQERALKLYTELIQEKPDSIDLTIELGRLYIALKQFQNGIDLFFKLLRSIQATSNC